MPKTTTKKAAKPIKAKPAKAPEASSPGVIMLETGEFSIGNKATGEVHKLDILVLQMTIEQVQARHQLAKDKSGCFIATPEFLTELAHAVAGLGVKDCTPMMAYQVWLGAAVAVAALQKKMRSVSFE